MSARRCRSASSPTWPVGKISSRRDVKLDFLLKDASSSLFWESQLIWAKGMLSRTMLFLVDALAETCFVRPWAYIWGDWVPGDLVSKKVSILRMRCMWGIYLKSAFAKALLYNFHLFNRKKRLTGYLIASCREIQLTKVESTHEGQRRPWGLALVRKKAECHCGRSGAGSAAHLAEDISCSIDLPSTRCLDSPSQLPEQAEKEKKIFYFSVKTANLSLVVWKESLTMSYHDILVKVGDFGLYQKLLCGIFVFYTTFLCGLNFYTQVFITILQRLFLSETQL